MKRGIERGESNRKKECKERKEGRMRLRERKKKSRDRLKNNASDISQGESEDKYFFFLPFCHLVGRGAPLIVPVWQYHFVLNLSFSLYLQVNVKKKIK